MKLEQAVHSLEHSLSKHSVGYYTFACKKAFVLVKLHGNPARFRFAARDKVVFRTDGDYLTVEKQDTGVVQRKFTWDQIECICAGEPEKDDGSLFQG